MKVRPAEVEYCHSLCWFFQDKDMILFEDEESIKAKSSQYEWDTYWYHVFNVMKKYRSIREEKVKPEAAPKIQPKKRKGYK